MSDTAVEDKQALDTANESQEDKEEQQLQQAARDYQKSGKVDGKDVMHVKIYSPYRDYFDGQAFSLSAENLTGPFDILPRHHNFISLLTPCIVIVRSVKNQEKPVRIRISGGIIHVKSDEVMVFLDV
ncbi:MAG TPA: hypothetical protein VFN51_00210 [Candidatus Saccharimonadales bacterium]|nr:hypothetical protein [Candidatus Saccharimonadales bacterium]